MDNTTTPTVTVGLAEVKDSVSVNTTPIVEIKKVEIPVTEVQVVEVQEEVSPQERTNNHAKIIFEKRKASNATNYPESSNK